ncbi:MAG: antitermination protein NusG [Phycisphaerae bacterium]|nr:antitermination protein NusG [Phycisphaerae bacterium]
MKLSENPPILTPGYDSLADLPGRWWVAHTKSRFEKSFAMSLLARGKGYFLPLVKRVTISGGRRRHVLAPLFPSYVFFSGDDEDRREALSTNCLCKALSVPDQDALVSSLTAIEKALAAEAPLEPYPHVAVGRRCRVTAGRLRGVEGVVIRREGRAQIVLEVELLGRGAVLEIEADLLEPID